MEGHAEGDPPDHDPGRAGRVHKPQDVEAPLGQAAVQGPRAPIPSTIVTVLKQLTTLHFTGFFYHLGRFGGAQRALARDQGGPNIPTAKPPVPPSDRGDSHEVLLAAEAISSHPQQLSRRHRVKRESCFPRHH